MLISLMPAPAGKHRWGANYVRQQVSPGEQFRRGNAPPIQIVALHSVPRPGPGAPVVMCGQDQFDGRVSHVVTGHFARPEPGDQRLDVEPVQVREVKQRRLAAPIRENPSRSTKNIPATRRSVERPESEGPPTHRAATDGLAGVR